MELPQSFLAREFTFLYVQVLSSNNSTSDAGSVFKLKSWNRSSNYFDSVPQRWAFIMPKR